VLRSRMCGIIPPLPNTSSWHGTFSSRGQLYLYITSSGYNTGCTTLL